MINKTATNWLFVSLMMTLTATAAVILILKSAVMFWFQVMFQSSQMFLG